MTKKLSEILEGSREMYMKAKALHDHPSTGPGEKQAAKSAMDRLSQYAPASSGKTHSNFVHGFYVHQAHIIDPKKNPNKVPDHHRYYGPYSSEDKANKKRDYEAGRRPSSLKHDVINHNKKTPYQFHSGAELSDDMGTG